MGSLEDELRELLAPLPDLSDQVRTAESVEEVTQALVQISGEVFVPSIAAQQEAIFRLAREIDGLRED